MVVTKSAVVTSMEMQFVIKIKNRNEVTYMDVERGEDQGDGVEVFGNFPAGDTILNAASDEIKKNTKIKIIAVSDEIARKK